MTSELSPPRRAAAERDPADSVEPKPTPRRGSGLFRAFWRWHFYASALVIPIFAMLSVTGLIMLFKWQIDPAMHPMMKADVPTFGSAVPLSQQEEAVREAFPDTTITAVQMGADDRATYFTVATDDGDRNVYVDPYDGQVNGSLDPRSLLSNIATEVHGMIVFGQFSDAELFTDPITGEPFTRGSIGDRIIELGACWAIVMTLTGYYLFVRGRVARVRRKAAKAAGAALRSWHGWVGAAIGLGILLLVVTGMPWTGLWGSKVQLMATGSPFSLWGEDPGAESNLADKVEAAGSNSVPAPWAEGQSDVPTSETGDGHQHHHGADGSTTVDGRVSIDAAVEAAAAEGLPTPYYILYPDSETGVFSVLADMWHDKAQPAYSDVGQEKVVHVDQYSGEVAGRYAYGDYAPAAKLVSQGIAIHEGQRFGTLNFWGSAAFCVACLFLCVSGPLMWWRRRPHGGGIAAPRGRMPVLSKPLLLVALVVLGVFLPLFGVSLLLVLLFDQLVVTRVPRLARALNVPRGR